MLDSLTNDQMTRFKENILWQIEASKSTMENTRAIGTISDMLSKLTALAYEQKSLDVINSLNFATRGERQSNVTEAYPYTFKWIFEEHELNGEGTAGTGELDTNSDSDSEKVFTLRPQTGFLTWLRYRSDIYWISGKAGSGKSTLMKYIVENARTKEKLESWAGQAKVVTASCFFSSSGDSLQKSQQGLLQSFLYEVLSQCPDLVPALCSSRCHDFGSNSRRWSQGELMKVFEQLIEQTPSLKLCFFVDGLDEFEGNHKEIVYALNALAKSPNVKICLSSRPLNVFQKAYGNSDQKLRLEEITKADIRLYVNKMLEADSDYIQLATVDARCKELKKDIASNAQGVFLWVRLVVSDLLRGLGNEDDIGDLQKRLWRLPNDLEDYYHLMLLRIDEFYRDEAAELFQLTREAVGPLHVLTITFYKLEKLESGYASKNNLHAQIHMETSVKECRRLLNTRCQGLLVANRQTVSYLHGTVRAFLSTAKMDKLLTSWSRPSFNATMSLLKATLAQMKLVGIREQRFRSVDVTEEEEFVTYLRTFMLYAHRLEDHHRISEVALIEELDSVGWTFVERVRVSYIPGEDRGHWTNWLSILKSTRRTPRIENFLDFAVQEGLHLYVSLKLQAQPHLIKVKPSHPLLDSALQPMYFRSSSDHRSVMVKLLLDRGARPTDTVRSEAMHRWRRRTVFAKHLRQIYLQRLIPTEDQYRITELMLEYGALSGFGLWYISMDDDEGYPERLTVPKMLRTVFPYEKADHLESILMRTQSSGLLRYINWKAYIARGWYFFDDTIYAALFLVIPAIPDLIRAFIFTILITLLSFPALALLGPLPGLIRLAVFGVALFGLFGSIALVTVWHVFRGLLGRNVDPPMG